MNILYNNNNSTLSIILSELIEKFNITEAELSRATKLPKATINRIKTGKVTDPKSSTLTLIANYFNISIDQLLGNKPLIIDSPKVNIIKIPIIEWDHLKKIKKFISDDIYNKGYTNWIHFECENRTDSCSLFALQIEGDAMWPYFDEKSLVIVDSSLKVENRDFVIAYIAKSDEVILRQILIDSKSKILIPLNTLFSEIEVKDQDQIIGVIAHVKKSF